MPWVRLHSIKGYNDMIRMAAEYPEVKQNFNLVPSLLVQIQDVIDNPAADISWQISTKPAEELNLEEKEFLLHNFFMANWDTMIRPYPRYWELLSKSSDPSSFGTKDLRDLQVYFNLVWFGYMARRDNPVLQELIKKGKGFSESDKKTVLETQLKVIKELLPTYKKTQEAGQVEISVSPFYHPILPLLMDTNFAKRAMPWAPLPERFNHPEDAQAQIHQALEAAQKLFGKRPKGMWPSEGSVCEEIVEMFANEGVEWIATDEEILLQSIKVEDRGKALYAPYLAEHKKKSVAIVFRDHALSDMIGFVYSKNNPASSADDLIGHLSNIRNYLDSSADAGLVSIILDGENPWEYYPDGGEAFLRRLFERLSQEKHFRSTTIGEFIREHPPKRTIPHLYSGSWIGHNYDIWIGSKEENAAWNLLNQTRDFLSDHVKRHAAADKKKLDLAWQEMYMAEGSDWFWWYGDDFSTVNDVVFDQLFRMHLANVYRILGCDVPEILSVSLLQAEPSHAVKDPVGLISPVLDGKVTHFYEWQEAGHFDARRADGAMHRVGGVLQTLYYGFDLHHLYLRVDLFNSEQVFKKSSWQAVLYIAKPHEHKIKFPLQATGKQGTYELHASLDDGDFRKVKECHTICIDKVVELSISFADLKVRSGDAMQFYMQIRQEKLELQRVPPDGVISLTVPDEEFETKMWSV